MCFYHKVGRDRRLWRHPFPEFSASADMRITEVGMDACSYDGNVENGKKTHVRGTLAN